MLRTGRVFVVAGAAILAGVLGYNFLTSTGLEFRVGKHEQKITDLSETTEKQGARIDATDQKVAEHERQIAVLTESMGRVDGELKEARARLDDAVAAGKATADELSSLRARVERLTKEHAHLKQDYDQRRQEILRLNAKAEDQDRINIEFERRLRELEKDFGSPDVPP